MKFTFEKGIKNIKYLEGIQLLDSITYSEKYLLTIKDYENRVNKNSECLYIVKNSAGHVIGYISFLAISYEAYERIKAGEVDKEVLTMDHIIAEGEPFEYIYWDSIIIDPKYRKYKLGKRLAAFGVNDLIDNHKEIKRIMAHAISKGGNRILSKYGFELKKKLDKTTVVMEKAFTKKAMTKKIKYNDKSKRAVEKKRYNVNNYVTKHL